ncbi:MAG: hypothetical protein ACI4U3_05795 [Traorella sp.]
MKEKELSKLSRIELLEILVEQSKEIERLNIQLEKANQQLKQREIVLKEAGSIAKASLELNHVFEAAQKAADQYLENVQNMTNANDIEKESQKKAEELLLQTKKECEYMKEETFRQCKLKIDQAKREIQDEWLTFNQYRKKVTQDK